MIERTRKQTRRNTSNELLCQCQTCWETWVHTLLRDKYNPHQKHVERKTMADMKHDVVVVVDIVGGGVPLAA